MSRTGRNAKHKARNPKRSQTAKDVSVPTCCARQSQWPGRVSRETAACCAKQTQFPGPVPRAEGLSCETKPICIGPDERYLLFRERVMREITVYATAKSKANLSCRADDGHGPPREVARAWRAKQSQISGRAVVQTKPIPRGRDSFRPQIGARAGLLRSSR